MLEVPAVAALADRKAGALEFGAHRAVADNEAGRAEVEEVHRLPPLSGGVTGNASAAMNASW